MLTQMPSMHASIAPHVTPVQRSTHAPLSHFSATVQAMQGFTHTPLVHWSPGSGQGMASLQLAAASQWPWLSAPGTQLCPGMQWTPVQESVHTPDTHFSPVAQLTPVHASTHAPAMHFSPSGQS